MVIDFNEDGSVKSTVGHDQGGICVQGSWSSVARSLAADGWGRLKPDDYVKQLVISESGIKLVIGWKGER